MERKSTLRAIDAPAVQGLVIPIDVEALCIAANPKPIFKQVPYRFQNLLQGAYLTTSIASGDPTTLPQGVHLHWALPDALTQGNDDGSGASFPAVPDRWLITRIFCDPDQAAKPRVDRWIIESNYYDSTDPNAAEGRNAVAMPFQQSGDDWQNQPWRFLGKVSPFTTWVEAQPNFVAGSPEAYITGLSAVGYGQSDFAASYPNCQNILGFNDLGDDLSKLGTAGKDKYLSYHIIGWYSNAAEDPIRQLPGAVGQSTFDDLLAKVADPGDRAFLKSSFAIASYELAPNVATAVGQQLWRILKAAGYPLEVDIPQTITPDNFQAVLNNTPNPADKAVLQANYLAQLAPIPNLSDTDEIRLWDIMATAGFDFLHTLLTRAKWSVPSGTVVPSISPSYTLYSGLITNVVWNANTDYFTSDPSTNFNIAVGNTAAEALSALIANTTEIDSINVSVVEEILDALQVGVLPQATSLSMLNDWELLQDTLHTNAFAALQGGYIWEVQAQKNAADSNGEVTLPGPLALDLNTLNATQLQVNALQTRIDSIRSQIYADWYRFMWINYPTQGFLPPIMIDPGSLAEYIEAKIGQLQPIVDALTAATNTAHDQQAALQTALGDSYFLSKVSAPRYWQPNDPVILFQGEGIDPSDRFGNDGRYMYDATLVCRLTSQLLSQVVIPAGAFGNAGAVTVDGSVMEAIPNPNGLPLVAGIDAVFTDAGLLNEDLLAAELRLAGVSTALGTLAQQIAPAMDAFLDPDVPQTVPQAQFEAILAAISPDDGTFLQSWYTQEGGNYVLKPNEQTDADQLHLKYIFISGAYNPSAAKLSYTGLAFSQVGIQAWDGNPWLPYSLGWSVNFFPLLPVPSTPAPTYPQDFVTSQFDFGNTDLEYTGAPIDLSNAGAQPYSNVISLTPHANINLTAQLQKFINANPKDPLLPQLQLILSKLGDKPVLSQAMSGFNEALVMLHKETQLPVADPKPSPFYSFSNTDVHDAVQEFNTERPAVGNSYNPIRVGLMQIANISLVDVFGRYVSVSQPKVVFRAQSMQQAVLKPTSAIYLPPRLTEAARLLFRWLSADDDTVEMNTHPATSPICGWVLANHLDNSLWIYDSTGNAYGALILNWDQSQVLWQCAPGSIYFGLDAQQFFAALGVVNPHLKAMVLSLYGDGGAASAAYVVAFMKALDLASVTVEPANYAQVSSNAVLMGTPLALVRASLDLELMGEPAYSQSWDDLNNQVNANQGGNFIWGNDYGFSKVDFPVKVGNVPQTSDGLIGYFKDDAYGTFYCPAVDAGGNAHVLPPAANNLLVSCNPDQPSLLISMLIDPRGVVHATSGILPVKTISIPPDQYVDALEKLALAFLTAPLLTSQLQLAMPLPAQDGGSWAWIENDGSAWSQQQNIAAVTVDAVMNYSPQQVLEGWLSLSNVLLSTASFNLLNPKAGAAVLYITDDPSNNAMTFTLTNKTNSVLLLKGGAPVGQSFQPGGSSIAFNFGSILPEAIVAGMRVSSPGWVAQFFARTSKTPAMQSVAPVQDITLARDASVSFSLTGITCPAGSVSGNFQIYYFGLPDVPDSLAPLLLPVSVQPLNP